MKFGNAFIVADTYLMDNVARDSSFHDKVVAVRLFRLGHLPPALYATEILAENGVSIVVLEYGNLEEKQSYGNHGLFPRVRWGSPWAKYVPSKAKSLFVFLGAALKLGLRLSSDRPALLIAHGLQESALVFLVSLFTKIPYVVHVHEVYEKHELSIVNRCFLVLEKWALRKALFLIFPEKNRAELYRKRYQLRQKIYLTFNCPRRRTFLNRRNFRNELPLDSGAKLLVYFGGVGPVNALGEAIEAVAQIPNFAFLIAGWGESTYLAEIKRLIETRKLSDRVFLTGPISSEKKWEVLESADLSYCVYHPTSLRLRYGATASNKLMEAFAAGLPVLTSPEADFREIVETYDVGICANSIDVPGIEVGLRALVEDEVVYQQRKQNALKVHQSVFNYEEQFAKPLDAFQSLIKRPQSEGRTLSKALP